MRPITVAATQFACSWDLPANADRAEAVIRQAAGQGAQAVLIQELFATPYFCITQRAEYLDLAQPMQGHPLIARFSALARSWAWCCRCPISSGRARPSSTALR